jgi:hypothetical protein
MIRAFDPSQPPFPSFRFEGRKSAGKKSGKRKRQGVPFTGFWSRKIAPQQEESAMHNPIRACLFVAAMLVSAGAFAIQMDGQLPMYPRGHNMNADMPANAIAFGVPLVLETSDAVHLVDLWYTSYAPKTCARSTASGGVKYACPGGSIMIYPHGGNTQIAFVPAMATMFGGH